MQEKNAKGTDITILHGHDATKNTSDLIIQILNSCFNIIGINIAIIIAKIITVGVYIFENLVMNSSVLPLLFVASYTKSAIWVAAEFL